MIGRMLPLMRVFGLALFLIASGGSSAWAQAGAAGKQVKAESKKEVAKDGAQANKKAPAKGAKAAPAPAGAKAAPTPAEAKAVVVEMKTNHGVVKIELDAEKAPISVKNFLSYVDDKFYDNTVFHRVISGFMVQGGGFAAEGKDLKQKLPKDPIANEAKNGLKNAKGTIAMARTAAPNSATSQFYINVADNAGLDYPKPDNHGYAVFGKVVSGMDVIEKIKAVPTTNKQLHMVGPNGKHTAASSPDVPVQNVVIESIRRVDGRSKS